MTAQCSVCGEPLEIETIRDFMGPTEVHWCERCGKYTDPAPTMGGYTEALESARRIIGSYSAIGRVCGGLSGEAVRRWVARGCPPRTEYTGETDYASLISEATGGEVPREDLLPETRRPKGWKKAA